MRWNIQVALDSVDLDEAIEIAHQVSPFVDILEAGTPLIKSAGIESVRRLRAEFPDQLIVADMKTLDQGAFEAELAFNAGADFTVVSGLTTLATIAETQREADQRGRRCIVDLSGVSDLVGRSEEVLDLGARLVMVHRSVDEEFSRGVSWTEDDCKTIGQLCDLGMDVMIAGGLGISNLPIFCDYRISAVVIGRAITAQDDPAAAAREMAGFIREGLD